MKGPNPVKIMGMAPFFIFLFSFSLTQSEAHLVAGEDKIINGYLIDFGYDPVQPKAEERVSFSINIVNATTEELTNIDKVWIRVSSQKGSIFAGNLRPENSNAAFTIAFPKSGKYEITTRFFEDENKLAEADFEIDVKAGFSDSLILAPWIIILIILLWKYIPKRKNNKGKGQSR